MSFTHHQLLRSEKSRKRAVKNTKWERVPETPDKILSRGHLEDPAGIAGVASDCRSKRGVGKSYQN